MWNKDYIEQNKTKRLSCYISGLVSNLTLVFPHHISYSSRQIKHIKVTLTNVLHVYTKLLLPNTVSGLWVQHSSAVAASFLLETLKWQIAHSAESWHTLWASLYRNSFLQATYLPMILPPCHYHHIYLICIVQSSTRSIYCCQTPSVLV